MECASCGSDAGDPGLTCPHCGYAPGRALVASGLSCTVPGNVLAFAGIGGAFLVTDALGLSSGVVPVVIFIGLIVGIAVSVYGILMALGGSDATIDEDYDGYALPVLS